jgi:vacuolar-type H+-ATPase subunit I/STV1
VSLGDHIATFEPKYKNIVVMLSRVHTIMWWLESYDFRKVENISGIALFFEEIEQFFKKYKKYKKINKPVQQSLMYNITIEDIKSFLNDDNRIIKYTEKARNIKREKEKNELQTKKRKLETLLKNTIETRDAEVLIFQQNYDEKIKLMKNKYEQLTLQIDSFN